MPPFSCFVYLRDDMPFTAFALVLIAALIHATWNLSAKHIASSGHGGTAFLFLSGCVTTVAYCPFVIWEMWHAHGSISTEGWLAIAVSAFLHLVYLVTLQRGYKVADLSIVYPLARGTGPLISVAGAVLFLGERPTWVAISGVLLVILGVFIIAEGDNLLRGRSASLQKGNTIKGVKYGFLTGVSIATYTVWDGYAVKTLMLAPLVLNYFGDVLRVGILAPQSLRNRNCLDALKVLWKAKRLNVLTVALLSPLSYVLVLYAVQISNVSRIAPARELSMMIAAFFGTKLLNEGKGKRRLLASGLIVAGIIALAL